MVNSVRFGFTVLAGTGKAGILKPDAEGYYETVLGALNVFNSAGDWYPYEPAKALFENSSQLMRRLGRGALRAEYGHPRMLPGQDRNSFAQRLLSIFEDRVCGHFKEIRLDFDNVKDKAGKPV